MDKIVGSALELSAKGFLDKYLLKHMGFHYIGLRKKVFELHSIPLTKLILLHTVVVLH